MHQKLLRFVRAGALLATFALLAGSSAFAQVTVSGMITDADTGEPLPGANVTIEGTTLGSATDIDGRYSIAGVNSGSYNLVATFVGFEPQRKVLVVRGSNVRVSFALVFANQSLDALEVFASRAIDRETPVAQTTVDKMQIQQQLGSRDIPLVLDTAPSVYATPSGGGAGDARINVRGFNQRNVAVMINGVPVNDMENGWVYWSNWDGVGDASSSIQLQRGLSAVNLATPSIGGTLNILTDPSAMRRGITVKQEVGTAGFFKTTAVGSTGLINGKYGLTVAGVRKVGDGLIDGTWTDAWAYYVAATYNISDKNRLDFFALGAPQRHGQNLYRQNIAVYSEKFALGLDSYEEDALEANGGKYNEAGREFNQNWGPISSSYTGQQSTGGTAFDRHNSGEMYERENFFHKPQINLNWYSQLSDNLLWSTVAYYSGGAGGGTGTFGSSPVRAPHAGSGSPFASLPWTWNWDATITRNETNATGSRTILRNSRNNQWTVGAISKMKMDLTEAFTLEVGVDWRTAEIEHYREVRDLLGGSYYNCTGSCASDFWTGTESQRGLGDKINYDFTNTVDWLGAFAQSEYKKDDVSLYGMVGLSTIKYGYTNHFRMLADGSELTAETDNISGFQAKGGGLRKLGENIDIYANVGFVSKVPIFDGVIDDVGGLVNPDPKNEKFYSFEAGTYFSPDPSVRVKLNAYSTKWEDRTFTRTVFFQDGTEGLINLTGLNALHKGVEAEVAYQPVTFARLDIGAAYSNWAYTDDATGTYRPDDRSTASEIFSFYVRDLKVGDAPQTQLSAALSVYPTDGLTIQGVMKHNADHYSDFDPFSRTDRKDRAQSWQTPAYQVFDLHFSYDLPIKGMPFDMQLFGHLFNVFDELYIQDSLDNSRFSSWDNDHDADDAEVYFGLPRTFNIGARFSF